MSRLSEEWISQLLDKNEIVSVLGEYVHLEKKGSRYWASCPWHAEKNPSFCVNQEKQFFFCFSCKKGGSIINFIMNQENYSYMEAVQYLAERVGMEMPEVGDDREYQKKRDYKQRLYQMMRDLAIYFHNQLKTPGGKPGLEYLKKRKIINVVNTFGLGFVGENGTEIYRYLSGKGYTVKEMMDAGLIKETNGRYYDFFRNRVMFPIQDKFGNVIAFGGRVMDDSHPKYLNSGETYLFNKRHHLYNLNQVRKIRNLQDIILTEGYMDVVGLRSVGIENSVASLGTALTEEQIRLIKNYTSKVYVCYDGDEPGIKATLRAIDMFDRFNVNISVISMPDGLDPDDIARNYGAEVFNKYKREAVSGIQFKINQLKKKTDLTDPDQKVQYATSVVAMIAQLKNEIEKERYLRNLSSETQLSYESLLRQMQKASDKKTENTVEVNQETEELESNEEKLMALIVQKPEILQNADSDRLEGFISNDENRKLVKEISSTVKKGFWPSGAELISQYPEYSEKISRYLTNTPPEGIDFREYGDRLLSLIRKNMLTMKRNALIKQSAVSDSKAQILQEIGKITKDLREIDEHIFRG